MTNNLGVIRKYSVRPGVLRDFRYIRPASAMSALMAFLAAIRASVRARVELPFKSTYEKYKVESPWLKERGLTEDTLKRFEVFEYMNPVTVLQNAARARSRASHSSSE